MYDWIQLYGWYELPFEKKSNKEKSMEFYYMNDLIIRTTCLDKLV